MISLSWLSKRLAVSAAVVALVALAAAVAIGMAYPEPVSSGALGPDWQCTRLALVFTTCHRVAEANATAVSAARGPACRRTIGWRYAFGFAALR